MDKVVNLAYKTIFIGVLVLCLKTYAYLITDSVALYSDALESIVNVLAAIMLLLLVRVSKKPADQGHHYGHYKAEYFSSAFEGVFIIIAAVAIFHEAYNGFFEPKPMDAPLLGILISSFSTLLNGLWGYHIIKEGKTHRSPAMIADGKHLISDVISSVGIVLGLILAYVSGWQILDPIIAFIVGIFIFKSGYEILSHTANGMMDAAPIEEDMNQIHQIIQDNMNGAIEYHDLRVRHAGRALFINFHLVVDGQMSVHASHDICDKIENALKLAFDETRINIHVEPEYKAKHDPNLLHK